MKIDCTIRKTVALEGEKESVSKIRSKIKKMTAVSILYSWKRDARCTGGGVVLIVLLQNGRIVG